MKDTPLLSKAFPLLIMLLIGFVDLSLSFNYTGLFYCLPIYLTLIVYNKRAAISAALISILFISLPYFIYYENINLIHFPIQRIISILFILSHLLVVLNIDHIFQFCLPKGNLEIQSRKISEELSEYANIILDNKGIIRKWNLKACEIFETGKEQVIGKHISFLSSEKDEVERTFQKLIANLKSQSKEITKVWLKRSNGSLFWAEIKLSLIFSPSGKFIGVTLLVKDIDNQKSLEQLLTVTNSLARVGGWEYDLIADELFWSETMKEIHEVPPDFVPTTEIGFNFYLTGKDRNRIREVFSNTIETGAPFEEELRIVTTSQKIKWVRIKAYPIIVNDVCKKIYGSFQDIHELKERELELEKSQDKFRKIFKYSPYGMARANMQGQILEGNKSYYELVGYTQEELDHLTIKDLTHPDDIPKDIEMFAKLTNRELENFEVDKRIYRKGGELRWVSIAVSRINNEKGEIDYFIAQLNDITEKKITEKKLMEQQQLLLENNKELNQYAHITSHDLQEPVRTINSFSALLQDQYKETIDDTGKKYLRFINEASNRLSIQIKGLLDYSRLGKLDKLAEKTDLNQILQFVTSDLATLITENKAIIECNKLPTIKVFSTEIKLLFQNLISNAIKFQSENNLPFITIHAKNIGEKWEFSIKDNGIGIDKKFHDRIFQIFQRLHDRNKFKGSGLGLAHCKKIVELHKGRIWLKSIPNEGSTFYFTICKEL